MTTIIPTPAPVPDPLSSDFGTKAYDFTVWMAAAAPAMQAVGEEINAALNNSLLGVTSSSTTSLLIGTGSKTLTVGTGLGYAVGMPLKIPSTANVNNYMKGVVTAYNSGTGSLTVNVLSVGGSGTFADWAVFFDIPDAAVPKILTRNITGVDTIVASDAGKLLTLSGTFTLGATAAATLGDGFYCFVRADSGTVTFDPNGSETVDGVTSGVLKGGYLLQSDGIGFTTMRLGGATTIQVLTSGTSWICPLGVRRPKARLAGAGSGCGAGSNQAGAGGGYCEGFFDTVPGTAYAYAIGAGTAGASGGSTTLAGIFTAPGGVYGSYPQTQTAPTGGSINVSGQQPVYVGGGNIVYVGGNSPFGVGGATGGGGVNVAAQGFGSGAAHSTTATAGQPGVITLEY